MAEVEYPQGDKMPRRCGNVPAQERRERHGGQAEAGQELVALDPAATPPAPAIESTRQHARVATNVDVTSEGDLRRQGQHEFDRRIGLKRRRAGEVKPSETDISRFTGLFNEVVRGRFETHLHRQGHGKSAGGPAFSDWVWLQLTLGLPSDANASTDARGKASSLGVPGPMSASGPDGPSRTLAGHSGGNWRIAWRSQRRTLEAARTPGS